MTTFLQRINRGVQLTNNTRYYANHTPRMAFTATNMQKGLYREWYAVLNGIARNRKQEISEAKFL